ncbi:AraC-like DNA-binding protein [Microbacterium sp. SORGH_AS 1204]|uniref:hypothetical protein n=1 Tax=Microbacterium sp. SORGH_AS_1204 TaxID=3041785 RepID=UPI00278FB25A|nr:hypothetical protein [Microbacterium sp. SORGH_AS_1204]MDQ1135609.1 AraC-like DNA-binding protein [Microbacterium sp. SORGH_AS_1204]
MSERLAAPNNFSTMTRGLTLRGDLASRWFGLRGWETQPLDENLGMRIHVDEFRTPSLTVRRIWHTPAALEPVARDADIPVIVLQAAGELLIVSEQETRQSSAEAAKKAGSTAARLASGGSAIFRPAGVRLSADRPTARIEVHARLHGPSQWALDGAVHSTNVAVGGWHFLSSAVNTLLSNDINVEVSSFPLLQSALEFLASAVMSELRPETTPGNVATAATRLRSRADRVMFDRAHDPEFTVGALPEMLGVSHSYLARAYNAAGTTAHRRLGELRARHAVELFRVGADDPKTIAARSGFSSERAMMRALRAAPLVDSVLEND